MWTVSSESLAVKVADFELPLGLDQDIFGLQVAMDDAGVVNGLESGGNLLKILESGREIERSGLVE